MLQMQFQNNNCDNRQVPKVMLLSHEDQALDVQCRLDDWSTLSPIVGEIMKTILREEHSCGETEKKTRKYALICIKDAENFNCSPLVYI